jgi:hypothetical protein
VASLLLLVAACMLVAAGVVLAATRTSSDGPARFVYSPYKHVVIGWHADTPIAATAVSGTWTPIAHNGRTMLPAGVRTLTLAFATGECGAETWDGIDARDIAARALRELEAASIGFIVSTGGAAGTFTCGTDAGMEAFIARYASPRLIGFDFDIERGQSDAIVTALAQRVRAAQQRHPRLRFSFTVATWAGSDDAGANLNADGTRVLEALRDTGVTGFYVNLMVMDYGPATPGNCVVAGAVCDMGRSAIRAAQNVHERFGIPLARIELTPMIGVNDVVANVLTPDDARTVARYVRDRGLGGLHFWSLDRDVACGADARGVSSSCHGMPGLAALAYTTAFRDALR